MNRIILISCLLLVQSIIYAQTRVEVLAGNDATGVIVSLKEKFSEQSKFGFTAIVNSNMPYEKENTPFNYYTIQSRISYDLGKKVNVFLGAFKNNKDYGSLLGLQANFPFKNGIFSVTNQHKLVKDYSTELNVLAEYRPKLNDKLHLYSRIQVMYETDFDITPRNWQMIRLGLDYKKFQFGFGATFDQFADNNISYENYGLFIRTTL